MGSSAPDDDSVIGQLERGRRQFLALVEPVRPELHRYCARMTGSIADGEDVVQETLASAYYELSQMTQLPPMRPWLFRIAHNRAIDHWRREQTRRSEPLDAALDVPDDSNHEPDHRLARKQAVRAAISGFLELAPVQRACVILKDVLEHSLDDIANELSLSLPAVKAALHRGRAALTLRGGSAPIKAPQPSISPALQRYASLFNAHDWDGVRALLTDDVKLDLV
jgi:RNA polymerase sigma-70 factor (ECF subfamily)